MTPSKLSVSLAVVDLLQLSIRYLSRSYSACCEYKLIMMLRLFCKQHIWLQCEGVVRDIICEFGSVLREILVSLNFKNLYVLIMSYFHC